MGATQVNLAWTAATDDIGVAGYQVERCAGVGCSAFVLLLSPTGTSATDTGLVPGTSYSYRVRALDAAGNTSAYSTTASATPLDTTAPTAPGTLTATGVGATQVNLAWTAATDNVGVAGYQVERCAGVGCSTFVLLVSPTGTSATDTGLVPGTSYSYRVRALDAAGNAGAYSTTASATPLDTTAPTAPGSLTATAVGATQVNLAWTAATDNVGVAGYQVERCAGVGCSTFVLLVSPTGTSASDTGVGPATSYSYRVRAVDAAGNLSAYSATASATTLTAVLTATVTAGNKIYDGTTSATVTGCTLNGVIASDVVTCAGEWRPSPRRAWAAVSWWRSQGSRSTARTRGTTRWRARARRRPPPSAPRS